MRRVCCRQKKKKKNTRAREYEITPYVTVKYNFLSPFFNSLFFAKFHLRFLFRFVSLNLIFTTVVSDRCFTLGWFSTWKWKWRKEKKNRRNETWKKKKLVWSLASLWWVQVILFKVDRFSYFLFRFIESEYIICQKLNQFCGLYATWNALSVYDEYWSLLFLCYKCYVWMMKNIFSILMLIFFFLAYRIFHNKVSFNANASERNVRR